MTLLQGDSFRFVVLLRYTLMILLILLAVGSSGRGGRFPSGRGGFRSDSFRGRGNYGGIGGRSFGRNEYVNWVEFSGRGRGTGGRGDGYQQGRGRSGRPSGLRHDAAGST